MADTAARQEKVDHKLKERIGILITKKIIQKIVKLFVFVSLVFSLTIDKD